MKKLQLEELGRLSKDEFKTSLKMPVVVVLDNIRSLHNVGSVFRTCDAFAVEAIYLCGITACPPNREIYKTALGSEETVSWKHFKSTKDAIDLLTAQFYDVYAIEQTSGSISLQDFNPPENKGLAIILGNEIDGVQSELLPLCKGAVEIPQYGTKHSFNVSVSAGIVLWEMAKKFYISH